MLIKFFKITLINILLFFNSSVKADNFNYIVGNHQEKTNQRIDNFFVNYPNEKRVFWVPEIKGKSRYAFSIQKDAYLTSKKYADASDLYYLSKKIDQGLEFQPNNLKSIDIFLLKNNFNAVYSQKFLLDTKMGLLYEKKENSYGLVLDKDFITSRNSMANLGIKQAFNKSIEFNAEFAKLSNNEATEFYGNLNHKFKSNILNGVIGYTWFEIANQFDFSASIQAQDKKIESNFYSTFENGNVKFQIGLDQIKNDSNLNMFFNLKFENTLNKKNLGTNVTITSKDRNFGLRNLSLKNFRKKNLDMLWKKYIKYK